jgi:branched-chain amino acid transport system ATP-binding protein
LITYGDIPEGEVLLELESIHIVFGKIGVLVGVSLKVRKGEIHSIIGPNGAGKTSLLNCVSGFYHPNQGKIYYLDHILTKPSPHRVSRLGIARAFQNIELFRGMTVLDNLLLARHRHLKYSFLHSLIYLGKASRQEAENRAYVEDIIDFMELEPYRKKMVGNLSYGIQKRVEVARALTLGPNLLLLDEPMAGMNIEEKEDMVRFIFDIQKERDITVILVEHDLGVVMDISDRVDVLDYGQLIGSGTPKEMAQNEKVIEAYIGED